MGFYLNPVSNISDLLPGPASHLLIMFIEYQFDWFFVTAENRWGITTIEQIETVTRPWNPLDPHSSTAATVCLRDCVPRFSPQCNRDSPCCKHLPYLVECEQINNSGQ